MANEHILLIENPAELSIDTRRVRIRRAGAEDAFVSPDDTAILVLHHHTINISVAVLQSLSAAGAVVMVTNELHMPTALLLPAAANRAASSRLRRQISQMATPLVGRLWQALVRSRIGTQAANLRALNCNGALRLERMIDEVEPSDQTHREGQAARHYWQHLFNDFKREKEGAEDHTNSRLNYGYAVLRSLVARELMAAGLSCELGLGHRSTENPFNLADDFMEPYRFTVERHVHGMDRDVPIDSKVKKHLVQFVETEVTLSNQQFRLLPAVRETINSYVRILETGKGQLALPTG